jgi:copper chaperone NosL
MSVKRWIVLTAALAMLAAACSTADAAGPPDINYGRDVCLQCGMIVSEQKFAAAYTLDSGEERSFDDLGDLILFVRAADESIDPLKGWVHDYETEEWVDLANAHFVPTLSVSTPMGHSIIAFADTDRAAAFAAEVDGEVIDWATVEQLPVSDNLVGTHHHNDMDMPEGHEHDDADI